MNFIQNLKIVSVLLVLLTPALMFVVIGPITGFEQKTQTDYPTTASVFVPSPEGREQLADAIFERSVSKRQSIQFINALHLYAFGFIDTERAITGSEQWLFYKPQFEAWGCDRHKELEKKLQRFKFIVDLISAAEVPLIFAHAPNKASIERGYLGGRTERYLDCYLAFEEQFTGLVSALPASHFVDHAKVLQHDQGQLPSYFKFDTHWTQAGGLRAMNQLFESRSGTLGVPLYTSETRNELAKTGTLSGILLLEQTQFIPAPISKRLDAADPQMARLATRVLIIHDSFYEQVLRYFADRSPNAQFLHSRSEIKESALEELEKAEVVVVEMIQRHFLDSVWARSRLGWGGTFAEWMLAEMAAAAESCNWSGAGFALNSVAGSDDQYAPGNTKLVQLPNDLTADRLCFRLELRAANVGEVNLYFSTADSSSDSPEFSDAMMVTKTLKTGLNSLALVLPETYRGKWIKLEPDKMKTGLTIQHLEFGGKSP
jgi:hypothetical protein